MHADDLGRAWARQAQLDAGPEAAHDLQILPTGQLRVSVRRLYQIADRVPQLPVAGRQRSAQHPHLAGGRFDHAQQHANSGGFAGPIESQKGVDFALLHSQGQPINGGNGPVSFYELVGFDGCNHLQVRCCAER